MNLRPRYSLRLLAVAVSLLCLYLGCWRLTKQFGVPLIEQENGAREFNSGLSSFVNVKSPAPFLVYGDSLDAPDGLMTAAELDFSIAMEAKSKTQPDFQCKRYWYVWAFGWTFAAPYESTWSPKFELVDIDQSGDVDIMFSVPKTRR